MPKIAVYARVSTTDKGQDAENQLRELREYCTRHDWGILIEYVDSASAIKNRPAFNQLLQDAASRRFDVLLVWKIDRLARSMSQFVATIQLLDFNGVRFISTTQGIDTDIANPASRLLMNVIASMAEFERALISERVKSGIARRQAKGLSFGGRKRIIVDAKEIYDLRSEGLSLRDIATRLKLKKSTVANVLTRYTINDNTMV